MTVYSMWSFSPDPIWIALAVGATVALIAGRAGRRRYGESISRLLLGAGLALLALLVGYSFVITWLVAAPPAGK